VIIQSFLIELIVQTEIIFNVEVYYGELKSCRSDKSA